MIFERERWTLCYLKERETVSLVGSTYQAIEMEMHAHWQAFMVFLLDQMNQKST